MTAHAQNNLAGFGSTPRLLVEQSMISDAELLDEYASNNSAPAFRALVQRYVPLVYSAALRLVDDRALAEDVTQVVFIVLGRNARQLPEHTSVAGWLHGTAHHAAGKALRPRGGRRQAQAKAFEVQFPEPEAAWGSLAPLLDDALAQLEKVNRDAVLLRYFRNRSLSEVERVLGWGEDTAEGRISQSLEKLRRILWRQGVAISLVTLSGLLATHAAQLAPADLGNLVTSVALNKAAMSTSVFALLQAMPAAKRKRAWPKMPARTGAAAALVTALCVAIWCWPKHKPQSSSFRLDSRIVMHGQAPARAVAAALPASAIKPAPPSPSQPEPSPQTVVQTEHSVPPASVAAFTNFPVQVPAVAAQPVDPGPPPQFSGDGYGQVAFPVGQPFAPVAPQSIYPVRYSYGPGYWQRPVNSQPAGIAGPPVIQRGSAPWGPVQQLARPAGPVVKSPPARKR